MQKQLHVALVYNIRPDDSNAGEKEMGGSEGGRRESGDADVLVAPRLKSGKTKSDTYAEWDTEETILAVETAIKLYHRVTPIEADEEAYQKLLAVRPDIVFNIAEGLNGPSREAQIPAILEFLDIPYTGSDPVTMGICLDKSRTKEILSYHGIPTPAFSVIESLKDPSTRQIHLPAIVKPLHEGSSKGIFSASVVRTPKELQAQVAEVLNNYSEPALVEQFLEGREFTVAMVGNRGSLQVFPTVEIKFDSLPKGVSPIYSYEAKWIWDQAEHPIDVHECPATIERSLEKEIRDMCKKSFEVLRCRDWCRMDVRLDSSGRPHILEVNPLPGILPNPKEHSCFPLAARAAGYDYNRMINSVLESAIQRYGLVSLT